MPSRPATSLSLICWRQFGQPVDGQHGLVRYVRGRFPLPPQHGLQRAAVPAAIAQVGLGRLVRVGERQPGPGRAGRSLGGQAAPVGFQPAPVRGRPGRARSASRAAARGASAGTTGAVPYGLGLGRTRALAPPTGTADGSPWPAPPGGLRLRTLRGPAGGLACGPVRGPARRPPAGAGWPGPPEAGAPEADQRAARPGRGRAASAGRRRPTLRAVHPRVVPPVPPRAAAAAGSRPARHDGAGHLRAAGTAWLRGGPRRAAGHVVGRAPADDRIVKRIWFCTSQIDEVRYVVCRKGGARYEYMIDFAETGYGNQLLGWIDAFIRVQVRMHECCYVSASNVYPSGGDCAT